jgi:hypothetical protein
MPRVLRAFLSNLGLLLYSQDYAIVLQIAWNLVSLAFRISEPTGLARSFCPDSLIDLNAKTLSIRPWLRGLTARFTMRLSTRRLQY